MPLSIIASVRQTRRVRYDKIYQPIPPMPKSAADVAVKLLEGVLPRAREITASPPQD